MAHARSPDRCAVRRSARFRRPAVSPVSARGRGGCLPPSRIRPDTPRSDPSAASSSGASWQTTKPRHPGDATPDPSSRASAERACPRPRPSGAARLLRKSCTCASAGCAQAGPAVQLRQCDAIQRCLHRQVGEADMLRLGALLRCAAQDPSRGIRIFEHHRMTEQEIEQAERRRNGGVAQDRSQVRCLQQMIDVVERQLRVRPVLDQRQAETGPRRARRAWPRHGA